MPDERAWDDLIVKLGDGILDFEIEARIRELERTRESLQGRITQLEQLKRATLENKREALSR